MNITKTRFLFHLSILPILLIVFSGNGYADMMTNVANKLVQMTGIEASAGSIDIATGMAGSIITINQEISQDKWDKSVEKLREEFSRKGNDTNEPVTLFGSGGCAVLNPHNYYIISNKYFSKIAEDSCNYEWIGSSLSDDHINNPLYIEKNFLAVKKDLKIKLRNGGTVEAKINDLVSFDLANKTIHLKNGSFEVMAESFAELFHLDQKKGVNKYSFGGGKFAVYPYFKANISSVEGYKAYEISEMSTNQLFYAAYNDGNYIGPGKMPIRKIIRGDINFKNFVASTSSNIRPIPVPEYNYKGKFFHNGTSISYEGKDGKNLTFYFLNRVYGTSNAGETILYKWVMEKSSDRYNVKNGSGGDLPIKLKIDLTEGKSIYVFLSEIEFLNKEENSIKLKKAENYIKYVSINIDENDAIYVNKKTITKFVNGYKTTNLFKFKVLKSKSFAISQDEDYIRKYAELRNIDYIDTL